MLSPGFGDRLLTRAAPKVRPAQRTPFRAATVRERFPPINQVSQRSKKADREGMSVQFITKKHISRRTVLRGMGASVALPLLDSMVPAQTPVNKTAAVA